MVDIQSGQSEQTGDDAVVDLTAEIVSAYVSNNNIPPAQLPELIQTVSAALKGQRPQPEPEPQKPAVPIRRSVQPEAITCLECGKKFKSIRRHLQNAHGLAPDEYRAKWGLPRDYPMAAPEYAKRRSEMAKAIGLGQKRQETATTKRRGRSAKEKTEAPVS